MVFAFVPLLPKRVGGKGIGYLEFISAYCVRGVLYNGEEKEKGKKAPSYYRETFLEQNVIC